MGRIEEVMDRRSGRLAEGRAFGPPCFHYWKSFGRVGVP